MLAILSHLREMDSGERYRTLIQLQVEEGIPPFLFPLMRMDMRSHRYLIDQITFVEQQQLAVDDPNNSTFGMNIDGSSSSRDQANIIFSAPAIELHLSVRNKGTFVLDGD